MPSNVKAVPLGYSTVTPHLVVDDGNRAIEFYKKAFGAELKELMHSPDGKSVLHCELRIGNSIVMLSDEFPMGTARSPKSLGGTTAGLFLYLEDVDSAFNRAVNAGAKVEMPVQDMFWGDRFGKVADPFGHGWSLATHKEDVAPEELKRRSEAVFREMCQRTQSAT